MIPACFDRHHPEQFIALAGRVVEANLAAEIGALQSQQFDAAAYHADACERWAMLAFEASASLYGARHG